MPTLLSRSKHEEFKSNSTSYIRDKKERREENGRKMKQEGNGREAAGTVTNGTVAAGETWNFR